MQGTIECPVTVFGTSLLLVFDVSRPRLFSNRDPTLLCLREPEFASKKHCVPLSHFLGLFCRPLGGRKRFEQGSCLGASV